MNCSLSSSSFSLSSSLSNTLVSSLLSSSSSSIVNSSSSSNSISKTILTEVENNNDLSSLDISSIVYNIQPIDIKGNNIMVQCNVSFVLNNTFISLFRYDVNNIPGCYMLYITLTNDYSNKIRDLLYNNTYINEINVSTVLKKNNDTDINITMPFLLQCGYNTTSVLYNNNQEKINNIDWISLIQDKIPVNVNIQYNGIFFKRKIPQPLFLINKIELQS